MGSECLLSFSEMAELDWGVSVVMPPSTSQQWPDPLCFPPRPPGGPRRGVSRSRSQWRS